MSETDTETTQQPADEIVRATAAREVKMSPTFVAYYTNDTQVETGVWDVRLRFGQIDEINRTDNRAVIIRTAEVRMSPQHAKRIAEILARQLDEYEKKFGSIPMPPE